MPRKKQETDKRHILPLPKKDNPDYFRALVRNCVAAYEKFTNNGLSLDYCKIVDQKLRAMVLADEEYRCETKSIYAQQRLEELEEIEQLACLAANKDEVEKDENDFNDPRDHKKREKAVTGADKDMLNMRFKAAQLKREIRADMSANSRNVETDAANFMFIVTTAEEFGQLAVNEVVEGHGDDDLGELARDKEEVPEGSGTLVARHERISGMGEDFFDVLENGEIVER